MKIIRNVFVVVMVVATAVLLVVAVAGTWATLSVRDEGRTAQAAERTLSSPHGEQLLADLVDDNLTVAGDVLPDVSTLVAKDAAVKSAVSDVLSRHAVADVPEVVDAAIVDAAIAAAVGDADVSVRPISFERPGSLVGAASDNAEFGVRFAPWLALVAMLLSVLVAQRRAALLGRICWMLRTMAVVSFLVSMISFALPTQAATLTMTVVLQSIKAAGPQTTAMAVALAVASGLVHVVSIFVRRTEVSLASAEARRLGDWDEYLTIDPHSAARPADHWTAPSSSEPFTIRKPPPPEYQPWSQLDDDDD